MKKPLITAAIIIAAGIALYLFTRPTISGTAVTVQTGLINTSGASGIALSGYDPVAFFTDGKATHGEPEITTTHQGAIYMFATRKHKKIFAQNPEKYAPQYGGFCSLGVSFGSLLPVDISTWKLVNGHLYLHLNPEYAEEFHDDFDNNLKLANTEWPKLIEKNKQLNAEEQNK